MNKAVVALLFCGILIIAGVAITALVLILRSGSEADDEKSDFECGKRYEHIEPRFITNGSDATLGSAPWFVSVAQMKDVNDGVLSDTAFCGGSIIDTEWVLTAAHCISLSPNFCVEKCIVVAGSTKRDDTNANFSYGTIHKVVEQFPFDKNTSLSNIYGKDIALLKVSPPFKYRTSGTEGRRAIGPVCLPKKQDEEITEKEGDIVGFGVTNDTWMFLFVKSNKTKFPKSREDYNQLPENLQAARVNIIPRDECAKIPDKYIEPPLVNFSNWRDILLDPKATICAGSPDEHRQTCSGDSGGPLSVDINGSATLVGITHYTLTEYCIVDPLWYTVYTRVSHFRDWIQHISGV